MGWSSVSQTALQHIDTDIASAEPQNPTPSTLRKNQFTTLVWDNIDFQEETISGQNTTHCVEGIAVQAGFVHSEIKSSIMKSRKRTLEPTETNIIPYIKRRKIEPECMPTYTEPPEEDKVKQNCKIKENTYFLFKAIDTREKGLPLPDWTGFNTKIHQEAPKIISCDISASNTWQSIRHVYYEHNLSPKFDSQTNFSSKR